MEVSAADNILRFGAEAPPILHLMAAVLLFLHIAGGSVALVAGAGALAFRKGARLHRAAGVVFALAMVVMLGVAAATSPFLPDPQPGQVYGGIFVIYLVATAWLAVKRPQGRIGRLEVAGCALAVLLALAGLIGALSGDAPAWAFVAIAGFCAACDLSVLRRGGLAGPARISRHLWRMCAALFVATGSFFLGQADEIPAALQGPHLMIPALAPLALMVFWLIRVRLGRSRRRPTAAPLAAEGQG